MVGLTLHDLCTQVLISDYRELYSTDSFFTNQQSEVNARCQTSNAQGDLLITIKGLVLWQ